MIIKKMKEHFEIRAIEWGMAGWAITWGLQSIFVPSMFTNPVTGPVSSLMLKSVDWLGGESHIILGMVVLLTGLLRLTALFINGLWKATPLIRILTSAVSGFVVMNIVVSLAQGPPSFGVVTYLWLFFADCFSASRAARDYHVTRRYYSVLTNE